MWCQCLLGNGNDKMMLCSCAQQLGPYRLLIALNGLGVTSARLSRAKTTQRQMKGWGPVTGDMILNDSRLPLTPSELSPCYLKKSLWYYWVSRNGCSHPLASLGSLLCSGLVLWGALAGGRMQSKGLCPSSVPTSLQSKTPVMRTKWSMY